MENRAKKSQIDYGLDAPKVVRNLFLFSTIPLFMSLGSFFIQIPLYFWILFVYSSLIFMSLFVTGCWMLYGIKIAKPRMASKMISDLSLKGDEKLLDLGCGQGLFLIEAAKHLPKGKAYGVDLWSQTDQSGNGPDKTLENAEKEGVGSRVAVHTSDIRSLPFANDYFDVVVSSLCLHNIKDRQEREKALLEMLRVLKDGGKFAIADIRHADEYAAFMKSHNIDVECSEPILSYCPPIRIVRATFHN